MQYVFTQYSIAMLQHGFLMHRIISSTKIIIAKRHMDIIWNFDGHDQKTVQFPNVHHQQTAEIGKMLNILRNYW